MLFSERSIWTMTHGIGLRLSCLRGRDRVHALRRMAFTLLAASFAVVAFVSLLGVFVNKVARFD